MIPRVRLLPLLFVLALLGSAAIAADNRAPRTPTDVSALGVSCNQIVVSWSPSTDRGNSGLAGYQVYRDGSFVGSVAGTSYSDTGLTPTSTHSYRVSAYDNAGNVSGLSSSASATTLDCDDSTPPSTPPGFSGSSSECASASTTAVVEIQSAS